MNVVGRVNLILSGKLALLHRLGRMMNPFSRAAIVTGNIHALAPEAAFEVVTSHYTIYFFSKWRGRASWLCSPAS